MEIAISNQIERLPEVYKPYIMALNSSTIKQANKAEALKSLIISLNKACAIKGQISDDNGSDLFIANGLYDLFIKDAPFASLGQIDLALKNGATGEYTKRDDRGRVEFEGINVATCWGWWKSFYNSDMRKQSAIELALLHSETPKAKSQEQIDLLSKEAILSAYKDFIESGELPNAAMSFYAEIKRLKGAPLIKSGEVKADINAQALTIFKQKMIKENPKFKQSKTQAKKLDDILESFEKEAGFLAEQGRLALKYYFNQCKKEDKLPI